MVVVSGTFRFPAGTADDVRAAMRECVAETVREKGCVSYRFYADLDEADVYRVFEEWDSGADLGAHGKSAHLAKFRETLKSLGMLERKVKIYETGKITTI